MTGLPLCVFLRCLLDQFESRRIRMKISDARVLRISSGDSAGNLSQIPTSKSKKSSYRVSLCPPPLSFFS